VRGLVPDSAWRSSDEIQPASQRFFDRIAPVLERLRPALISARWAELPFYSNLRLIQVEVATGKKPPYGDRRAAGVYGLVSPKDESAVFPLNLYRFERVAPDSLAGFDSSDELEAANAYAELTGGLTLTDDTVTDFVRFTMAFRCDENGQQYRVLDEGDKLELAEINQPLAELLDISYRLQQVQDRFGVMVARVLSATEYQPKPFLPGRNINRYRWLVTAPTIHAGVFSTLSYYVNPNGVVTPSAEQSAVPMDGIAFEVPTWQFRFSYDGVRTTK